MYKILICDDNEDIRDTLGMIFNIEFENECEFTFAVDGLDGIKKFSTSEKWDLIISDLEMPQKNGYEFFEYNLENGNFPFFLMSGNEISQEKLDKLKSSNVKNNFIAKPMDSAKFTQAMNLCLKEN